MKAGLVSAQAENYLIIPFGFAHHRSGNSYCTLACNNIEMKDLWNPHTCSPVSPVGLVVLYFDFLAPSISKLRQNVAGFVQ